LQTNLFDIDDENPNIRVINVSIPS
jgi:hypothetical protein